MRLSLLLLMLLSSNLIHAEEIRVAVASNFSVMKLLAERFEAKTTHKVSLIFGATGRLYTQIIHAAPFDAFFAADSQRPQLLEQAQRIVKDSRFTYAQGRLVLWSPSIGRVDAVGAVLQRADFHHLAIANPKLAPYGKAAEQVMQALGVWDSLQARLVRGENIAQTFQFVQSANAELGFVAYAQIKNLQGDFWLPSQTLYEPIKQQAVLLKDSPVTQAFMRYIQSAEAKNLIENHGYICVD